MSESKNNNLVDLHVHTNFSDGVFSPEEIVHKASSRGLRAIAITDHDSVGGISPAIEASKNIDLEIIPGVEVSAVKDHLDIHILGYFVDWQDPALLESLRETRESRVHRMKKIIYLLSQEGINIDVEKVLRETAGSTVGRLHLAQVLVEENVTRTIKEAFDRYLGDSGPCHVGYERLDYIEAINIIKASGGVPVLGHPGSKGKDEFIPDYVKAGLSGLEAMHTRHNPTKIRKYCAMAEEYGLLVTGGSDYHGVENDNISIGSVEIGYEIVDRLRAESEKIRRENL